MTFPDIAQQRLINQRVEGGNIANAEGAIVAVCSRNRPGPGSVLAYGRDDDRDQFIVFDSPTISLRYGEILLEETQPRVFLECFCELVVLVPPRFFFLFLC